jgi:hypothetical protein
MKNISKHILVTLIGLLFIVSACQKDDYKLGELIAPSNVTVAFEIVGADAEHPNGDGSGVVNFTATADHEITFTFDFGDGKDKQIAADGTTSHLFSTNGTVIYNVTVSAVGTGGISSTKTIQVEVYSSFADDEAKQFLTGGTTKSWYWAADQPGHLGLGPNDMVYENGSHTYAAWYMSAPWEKSATSLYQCEFKFSVESGSFTFEQLNPTGEAFVQGNYASEFGLGAEGSYPSAGTPFDISGVKSVSFSPSASIATIDGGYRGTTMNFSNGGYMGFYAGSSEYEIIEVTENILKVRVVQVNTPLFAWYHTFTNVKPEQK